MLFELLGRERPRPHLLAVFKREYYKYAGEDARAPSRSKTEPVRVRIRCLVEREYQH
jgi:hypothetical protein